MPRQKPDGDHDSHLLDTDGYLITSGCYYKIRLPDRREMNITQSRAGGWYGPVGVSPANSGDLFWFEDESWPNDQKVTIGVLNPTMASEKCWLSDGEGELGWGKDVAKMPFFGRKVSGQNRNFMWEEFCGRMYVGENVGGSSTVKIVSEWDYTTERFVGSFEVEFVYVRDISGDKLSS